MDRKQYLEACQQNSIGTEQTMIFDGIEYRPKAYMLAFDNKGATIHTCILQDLNSRCVVYAPLEKVKSKEATN